LERGQNPKKVVFGSREVFENLKKEPSNWEEERKAKTEVRRKKT
jgi:hypothetical protein